MYGPARKRPAPHTGPQIARKDRQNAGHRAKGRNLEGRTARPRRALLHHAAPPAGVCHRVVARRRRPARPSCLESAATAPRGRLTVWGAWGSGGAATERPRHTDGNADRAGPGAARSKPWRPGPCSTVAHRPWLALAIPTERDSCFSGLLPQPRPEIGWPEDLWYAARVGRLSRHEGRDHDVGLRSPHL